MFPVIFVLMLYNIFQLNCTMFISVCTTLYIEIIIDFDVVQHFPVELYNVYISLYNLVH